MRLYLMIIMILTLCFTPIEKLQLIKGITHDIVDLNKSDSK